MELITCALAERLETAEAADGACCAEAEWILTPRSEAAAKPIAGGFVLFLGATSPLTHALGIGMHGPVSASDMDAVEQFYRSRDCPITIDVCPYADSSLRELLFTRGYRVQDFSNVMVRRLRPDEALPEITGNIEVSQTTPLDIEVWADTVVRGFFSRDALTEEEMHLGRLLFSMPATTTYLAFNGDEPVGGAALSCRRGVANFFGDAVLPAYRCRGAHGALIRARLAAAVALGCEIATAGTQPGGTSQLNYQRLGFQIAYTKVTMVSD